MGLGLEGLWSVVASDGLVSYFFLRFEVRSWALLVTIPLNVPLLSWNSP